MMWVDLNKEGRGIPEGCRGLFADIFLARTSDIYFSPITYHLFFVLPSGPPRLMWERTGRAGGKNFGGFSAMALIWSNP